MAGQDPLPTGIAPHVRFSLCQIIHEAGMNRICAKQFLLTGYMEFLIRRKFSNSADHGFSIEIITPENPAHRGCQLSLVFSTDTSQIHKRIEQLGVVVSISQQSCTQTSMTECWPISLRLASGTIPDENGLPLLRCQISGFKCLTTPVYSGPLWATAKFYCLSGLTHTNGLFASGFCHISCHKWQPDIKDQTETKDPVPLVAFISD